MGGLVFTVLWQDPSTRRPACLHMQQNKNNAPEPGNSEDYKNHRRS